MIAVNVPVNVAGMDVCPGEIIHMDENGAVKFPREHLPGVYERVQKLLEIEKTRMDRLKQTANVEQIVDVWKFNSVRLCAAIGWEFATENNKDLDGIVKAFTERKIIVMLEVHDYTGSYPPDEGYRRGNDVYVYSKSVLIASDGKRKRLRLGD